MVKRTAVCMFAAGLMGLSLAGVAYAARSGHGGHFAGGFHGGPHHFAGGHFHGRVFIGGAVFAPFYYPPPYYDPYYYYYPPPVQYIEPYPAAPAPQPSYWYYCPGSATYYPYVQQCPGGWQTVPAQPPS